MTEYDFNKATTTSLNSQVASFTVSNRISDGGSEGEETYWDNSNFPRWFGYYKTIPEYKTAINGFATWVLGKGWTADINTTALLKNISGWGEDTFMSILWNLIVMKKIGGDAYAEIIRNEETGEVMNLKPLDPFSIRHVTDKKGIIKRYEQFSKSSNKPKIFQPYDILHLCNERVADEIHGTSITEAVEWVIDARNEAMRDWRRLSHRSTIRIMYIDSDDTAKLQTIKNQYKDAINKGELMIFPAKKEEAGIEDFSLPPIDNFLRWIQYLENFFYQAIGVPKVILGGSEEFTEASSKIGYLTFEQIYTKEIEELKADLFNQLGITIEFIKPASIKNELLNSETKNTGQVGFQPNDVQAGVGQ